METKDLKSLRKKIDSIDDRLLDLIVQRSSVVEKIGNLKKNQKKIVDKKREAEVISRLLQYHKGNFSKDSIIRIWREIFHTSANIQLKKNNILQAKRGIEDIKLYKGGRAKIKGIKKIIKLSSNESPFGPSKKAKQAYEKSSSKLSRYPELTAESLQIEIAKKNKLNADQIICGTGSDEILIFALLTFCAPGDEVIHAKHGFEMYPIVTKYAGAETVLASEEDYKISIKSVISNITDATKIILIANPNNPTGTYLNKKELKSLMKKIPSNIVVVVDGAYAEFADANDYDKSFDLINNYNNLLITRTFSKAYSLAGLRLGWGYGSKILIESMKKVRPPFNLPPGAIAAGIAALKDDKHLDKIVSHNSKIKPWFIDNINKLGLKAYDSQANFIFIEVPKKKKQSAILLNNFLLSKGIAVRHLESYNLVNAVRITLGTKEELKKTLQTIKMFINNNE